MQPISIRGEDVMTLFSMTMATTTTTGLIDSRAAASAWGMVR
jgi:hypothetical protein